MKIGVVGLGLIGGSIARAIKQYTNHAVCGVDTDPAVISPPHTPRGRSIPIRTFRSAMLFSYAFTRATAFLICCIRSLKTMLSLRIFQALSASLQRRWRSRSKKKGLRYVGTHPMAGRETSGFEHSDADLFKMPALSSRRTSILIKMPRRSFHSLPKELGFSPLLCAVRESMTR